jgi:hypothetical protein
MFYLVWNVITLVVIVVLLRLRKHEVLYSVQRSVEMITQSNRMTHPLILWFLRSLYRRLCVLRIGMTSSSKKVESRGLCLT